MKSLKNLIETRYGSFFMVVKYSARDKVYLISLPAFPDVTTEARSIQEAKKFAKEVIELQCMAALDDGKIIIDDTRRVRGRYVRSGALALVA